MASKLEQFANEYREKIIKRNSYNIIEENNYTPTHRNAISDGDAPGKGTGVFLDTYNGGGDLDINGNPNRVGTGRVGNIKINKFDEDNQYTAPDTRGNDGQARPFGG